MRTRKLLLAAGAALALTVGATANATILIPSGIVTTFGDTTGAGPWELTSTPTTFSGVNIQITSALTFGDLSTLSATFEDLSGGAYGGSPRFYIGLMDGVNEKFMHVVLGTSPSYADNDPGDFTAAYSGFNVINNNDAGRYDDSQFTGGSPFTDYASALAREGALSIADIGFVVDGGWGANGDQHLTLDSVRANQAIFHTSAVPEPSTISLMVACLGLAFFVPRVREAGRITA